MDFTRLQSRSDELVQLSGDWLFFPGEFVSPDRISQRIATGGTTLPVPGTWNDLFPERSLFSRGTGYGTYAIELRGIQSWLKGGHPLLYMKDALTAYRMVFVPHGSGEPVPVMGNGVPGENDETSIPQLLPVTGQIPPGLDSGILLLHVSNFNDNFGGMVHAPTMGNDLSIVRHLTGKLAIDFFILGTLFLSGIYHLILRLFRQEDQPSLLFGLINLIIAFRMLLTEKYIQIAFPQPNEFAFEFFMKLDYATFYVAVPLYVFFIISIFHENRFPRIKRLLVGVAGLFLSTLIFPQVVYGHFLQAYQAWTGVWIIFLVHLLVRATREKQTGATASLVGGVILFVAVINDILYSINLIFTMYLLSYGFIIFIMAHSLAIAARFARTHSLARHLSQKLQKEVEKQTSELVEKNFQLEQANGRKDLFLQNISHEIRTPLTLIHSPLQEMAAGIYGPLNGAMDRTVQIMKQNSERLLQLINQLLDLSRLEAGELGFTPSTLDLGPILERVCESFSFSLDQKELRIQKEIPSSPVMIQGDEKKLVRIFTNLLSNALKFTPTGGTIRIHLEKLDDRIQIAIEDSGIGIEKKDIPHIFERFRKVERTRFAGVEGSGIGLSIVKAFVEMHNGQISVSSEPDRGTRFTISFPTGTGNLEAEDSQISRLPMAAVHGTGNGSEKHKKILIVEDHEDMRIFIHHILDKIYDCTIAANGREGLNLASQNRYDLILTDYMMPVMDGISMVRELKNIPGASGIPVLILSAGIPELADAGLTGSATLSKPFKPDQLKETVRALLARK